jgi:hypothetical protein
MLGTNTIPLRSNCGASCLDSIFGRLCILQVSLSIMAGRFDPEKERARAEKDKEKAKNREMMADVRETNGLLMKNLTLAADVLVYTKKVILSQDRGGTPVKAGPGSSSTHALSPEASPAPCSPTNSVLSNVTSGSQMMGSTEPLPLDEEGGLGFFDRRSTKLCGMPVRVLRSILTCLERIALNAFSIRALCERGQREAGQFAMAEVVEFATGVLISGDAKLWNPACVIPKL